MLNKEESIQESLLKSYFHNHGLLLCNDNKILPSLSSVGGDWNSIVAMIEQGEVFYSKLYQGRVTYLSQNFYAQIKPFRQRFDSISQTGREIYDFLDKKEYADTAEIKNIFMLSGKEFSKNMDELFKALLVTAIKRKDTINANWSSFYWGTYKTWEERHPLPEIEISEDALKALVSDLLTARQMEKLLK